MISSGGTWRLESRGDGDGDVVRIKSHLDPLTPLPTGATKLVSTEVFRFRGLMRRVAGIVARRGIHSAHRRHMEAFKRFAENN